MLKRVLIEAATELYLGYFRHHLASQETKVLPRAVNVLTPEDWAAVATAVLKIGDPLFGEELNVRYQELCQQISRQA
jgi:hemerythrin-like domain-containing protein